MKNICIRLLNCFTEKELFGFDNFLHSGIFYTNKKIYVLFNELKKYAIGKNYDKQLTEVSVYNVVFNKSMKTLNAQQKKQLNNLMSALTRIVEDFIIYQQIQNNYELKQEVLYRALLQKKQIKLLQKHLNTDKKKIGILKKKTNLHYRYLYQLEHYNFQIMHQTGLLSTQDNLKEINENLDVYYVLEKLSLWMSMLSLEQITQRKFDHSAFNYVEDYVKNPVYAKNPTVKIYMAMINLLRYKTEIFYIGLLQLLNEYKHIINDEVLIAAYNIATNFCSFNIKKGIFTHLHLFELYQILDEKNLLLENGFMPVTKLKNLVAVACRTKKFSWGEKILKKYIVYVNKPFRKSVNEFNLGVINFYQQKYDTALQNFIRVDDVNLTYDINYRIMVMKAHYEVDASYDERTLQIFRSAEKYFVANKLISANNRTAYKNFVRMLINLYRIKHKVTRMKTAVLLKKLNVQKLNHDKSWLVDKLKEL